MVSIKTKEEIGLIRESGRIAAEILKKVQEDVKPGVSTQELNELAEELIIKRGVKSAFRGQISGAVSIRDLRIGKRSSCPWFAFGLCVERWGYTGVRFRRNL